MNNSNLNFRTSKFILLFYAIGSVVIIPFIGQLTLSEIIVAISIPFLNYFKLLKKFSLLKTLLTGFSILFLAQIISDIINQSAIYDFSRGLALIVFSIFSTFFLVSKLSQNNSNVLYYVFLIFIIQLFFGYGGGGFENVEVGDNYFKFRFAPALGMLAMFLSCECYKRNKKMFASLILILNAIVCMIFAARSYGLIFFIAGIMLYLKNKSIKIDFGKILFYFLLLTILLYILYIFYANQVVYHGFGGLNSKNQFSMMKNIYNPFELLIYGRTDFFVTLQAISDNPFWGYGSWAKDHGGHYTTMLNVLSSGLLDVDTGYIPIHSVFIGTWATAGLLGFFATLYIFVSLFKKFLIIYRYNGFIENLPLIIGLTVDMFWSYFFSPLSLLRNSFPLFAAVIIIEYNKIIKINNQISNSKKTIKNI